MNCDFGHWPEKTYYLQLFLYQYGCFANEHGKAVVEWAWPSQLISWNLVARWNKKQSLTLNKLKLKIFLLKSESLFILKVVPWFMTCLLFNISIILVLIGEAVLYNIFYEVFSACTSIVAQDKAGRVIAIWKTKALKTKLLKSATIPYYFCAILTELHSLSSHHICTIFHKDITKIKAKHCVYSKQ